MTKEEAIEIVKEFINSACLHLVDQEALETLIPELRENEDEKIREWCISHFKECFRVSKNNLEYRQYLNNKIIPWLEKQKDHLRESAKMVEQESIDGKALLHTADKSYEIGYRDGKMDAQKEQKPADEQFPPLEGLDAIKAKYYDDDFKNGFDEGVESVKPAEWSEADKAVMLNTIIADVNRTLHSCGIGTVEHHIRSEAIKFLKSLRSSWKPTEEQMKALHRAVKKLVNSDVEDSVRLFIMYDNLKKLM